REGLSRTQLTVDPAVGVLMGKAPHSGFVDQREGNSMSRRGPIAWIVPLILLAAACAPSSVAPGASTAANAAAAKPASCGTFTDLQSRDIASLDPLSATVSTVPQRIGLVYPRLVYYDYPLDGNPADAGPVPGYITEKWSFSDGG